MERNNLQQIVPFWNSAGQIIPHRLYEFFTEKGIGNFFTDDSNKKNTEPVIVKIVGNTVSPVNVGYLLDLTKSYILEATADAGNSGPILDSLHTKTALFGDKNLKLLKTIKLNFISDTPDAGYFFFQNGVVEVKADAISLKPYTDFEDFVWEKSIVPVNFEPVDMVHLQKESDFMRFLEDLTVVADAEKSAKRLDSLKSAIGYLLHRFKDPATTKAIIIMDVYVNGQPNGGSGKTLLIKAIGKVRIVSILDGKKYDQREWFALSSVDLESEILLFDDIERNFDFEQIFPLMSTGMLVRLKYKNHVFLPFERAPKVAITTNYAVLGSSSSHIRRKFEFEVSATFSAGYTPRDKFGHNFFDGWDDQQWNLFYNTMFHCLQVFLKFGLIESEPVNLNLTKLINRSCEEFVDWAEDAVHLDVQFEKKLLYDKFVKAYPEYSGKLKQREFTFWLRAWGEYKCLSVTEGHSDDKRTIVFTVKSSN